MCDTMLKSGGDGGHFTCYAVRMRMLVLLLALVIVHSVSSLPRTPLPFYTLLEWPDVVDMVSPFLLMACYWQLLLVTIYHLFKIKLELALRLMFLFSIISVLFALGHGMHNGSNAVGHLIPFKEHEALAHWHDLVQREQGRGDSTIATTIGHATPSTFASSSGGGGGSSSHSNNNNNAALVRVFWLSFLYDEQLGHMISHAAWIAWDVLLLVLHLRILFPEHRSSAVRDTDRTHHHQHQQQRPRYQPLAQTQHAYLHRRSDDNGGVYHGHEGGRAVASKNGDCYVASTEEYNSHQHEADVDLAGHSMNGTNVSTHDHRHSSNTSLSSSLSSPFLECEENSIEDGSTIISPSSSYLRSTGANASASATSELAYSTVSGIAGPGSASVITHSALSSAASASASAPGAAASSSSSSLSSLASSLSSSLDGCESDVVIGRATSKAIGLSATAAAGAATDSGAAMLQVRRPQRSLLATIAPEVVSGVISGLLFFGRTIEGQTAPLAVPLGISIVVYIGYCWAHAQYHARNQPFVTFLVTSYLTGLLLIACWWTYFGSLPEFSELGWIA